MHPKKRALAREYVMGPSKLQCRLLAEVSHQINSPLAAIRNALYLAAHHSCDPEVIQYLEIADQEVTNIVSRIRDLREAMETEFGPGISSYAPHPVQSLRKAA
jgi:signal transduction histidine kinase